MNYKTFLLSLSIISIFTTDAQDFFFQTKRRAALLAAPALIAYGYNAFVTLAYAGTLDKSTIQSLYWHQNLFPVLGFQALTYYCWSKAFSSDNKPDDHQPVYVTISRTL